MGPTDGLDHGGIRWRHDDRQHFHPGAPAGCDRKKGGRDVSVVPGAVSRPRSTRSSRQGLPVRLSLKAHDAPEALARPARSTIDKAYDGNAIRDRVTRQVEPKVATMLQDALPRTQSGRALLQQAQALPSIATRYDKLADNFLAMVKLASMRLWLRAYESTSENGLVRSRKEHIEGWRQIPGKCLYTCRATALRHRKRHIDLDQIRY